MSELHWANYAPVLYKARVEFLVRENYYVGYSSRMQQRKEEHADRKHEWCPHILKARSPDTIEYVEKQLGMVSFKAGGFGFSVDEFFLKSPF